jgi:hypothetical protein
MRVVVIGATGNVGTAVLRALRDEDAVDEIVGVARRRPDAAPPPKTTWATADISRDELEPLLAGADCVVHLAWLIQPSRDESVTHATNVTGSARVFAAAARAGWIGETHPEHIWFGTMLGEDGKPFKTRSGGTIRLSDLLDEAVERARAVVDAKSPELPEAERAAIAGAVAAAFQARRAARLNVLEALQYE